jgi:hypothetical protein
MFTIPCVLRSSHGVSIFSYVCVFVCVYACMSVWL